jgi:hypothetical protein
MLLTHAGIYTFIMYKELFRTQIHPAPSELGVGWKEAALARGSVGFGSVKARRVFQCAYCCENFLLVIWACILFVVEDITVATLVINIVLATHLHSMYGTSRVFGFGISSDIGIYLGRMITFVIMVLLYIYTMVLFLNA